MIELARLSSFPKGIAGIRNGGLKGITADETDARATAKTFGVRRKRLDVADPNKQLPMHPSNPLNPLNLRS